MMVKQMWAIREEVRKRKPLVYNITNNVVTNFTANVLLAAGAAPIMSESAAEADDLAKIADVLVLNIGTLFTRQISYCLKAGECANKYQKPVVFDPVGVGATAYRNMTSSQILADIELSLIRGNYGEISTLAGLSGQTKGVDSVGIDLNLESFKLLAQQNGCLIAATGQTDYLTDGFNVFANETGHETMQLLTGTGCALSAVTGAFLAVAEDRKLGVLAALAFYGAAGQKAAASCKGPGSFAVRFLDALYNLSYKEFKKLVTDKTALLGTEGMAMIVDGIDLDATRESGSEGETAP
ncbi:MAG TPA: hydroxyethylthiazole kinase [Negativicutes bacterium]